MADGERGDFRECSSVEVSGKADRREGNQKEPVYSECAPPAQLRLSDFSGERTPSRDKVIALCLAMGLTPEEAHSLLCHTGFSDIYPKNRRDSVLIFALERKLTVLETNELLYELGEELL